MSDKAWVISVNMGYGHQRTAFPLKSLAPESEIINANDYEGIPEGDRRIWETTRKGYEFISNFKRLPLLGNLFFSLFDRFQKIFNFYSVRNFQRPSYQLKQTLSLIRGGWGKHLVGELIAKNRERGEILPVISSFFTPAFMAEYWGYPGDIFCIVCDADISRTWAPLHPKQSKIKYFAPTERVAERLELYGVKHENIFLTGYPLPEELLGEKDLLVLKDDLRHRLLNLDPQKRYSQKYEVLIKDKLGKLPAVSGHPLTLLFSVGGAGAQKELAIEIVRSLKGRIKKGEIRMILSAGTRAIIQEYFQKSLKELFPAKPFDSGVEILFGHSIQDYFQKFNNALRTTDILWTKPSELSFYAVLGLPIIIAPTIGSQEEFNKRWLVKSGFGIAQENPNLTEEWLLDWLNQGFLAEAAMQGFVEGEKSGTMKIKEIIRDL